MACMTHDCFDCKNMWFNNQIDSYCPACGSDNIVSLFDEPVDHD